MSFTPMSSSSNRNVADCGPARRPTLSVCHVMPPFLISSSTRVNGPRRDARCRAVIQCLSPCRGDAPPSSSRRATASLRSSAASLAHTTINGVSASSLESASSPAESSLRTMSTSARLAASTSGRTMTGKTDFEALAAAISAAQLFNPYWLASCRCADASFKPSALARRFASLCRNSRDGWSGRVRREAFDVAMVNPFLECPVSAHGQEKVASVDSYEGGLSPFRGRVAAVRPASLYTPDARSRRAAGSPRAACAR